MKIRTTRPVLWTAIRFVTIVAIGMATAIVPSKAVQHRERVEPEVKVGGLTVAEQRANQLQLNEKLTALLPSGFDRTPLRVEITEADKNNLLTQPPNGTAPLRIGVVKSLVNPVGKPFGNAFNYGVIRNNSDGSFVWAMTVTSPGAQAIRLYITDFSLPNNTEMYFMNDIGQADGPYTGVGRNSDGAFWTHSVASESGQLVVRYAGNTPETDLPRMSFVVSEVALILGRPPQAQEQSGGWPCSDNAPCLVDANCVSSPADLAKSAVAKMEWIKGPYIYTCTGGLLADTNPNSQIPYFLTANHCLSSSNSNLETFFNYTTDSCRGTCPDNILTGGTPPPASTIGATVVATGRKGDFTLMTLNQPPPAGSTFLGWDRTPIASSNSVLLYRISNANFGPQVYSKHEVDPSSPTCTMWPRGERIYSTDLDGATMGGSSGSPVLNADSKVVGQLSGCCGYDCSNVCDSEYNWTVDGALAYYWNSVAQFLDPQGGGCTTDLECDDGLFCTGSETCVSGSCQSSGDPCQAGEVCDESSVSCSPAVACFGNKASCNSNDECCSGNCKNNTCRGN